MGQRRVHGETSFSALFAMDAYTLCTMANRGKIINNLAIIAFVVIVMISSCTPTAADAAKQIFILAGQSNMAGRGRGVYPPDISPDPARIFRLSWNLNWVVAREPLHQDIDVKKKCGVGPGMAFANAIKSRVGSPIGLVPCAIGGTQISEWARGTTNYNRMMTRAKSAAAQGGEIKALLWYQGESNTNTLEQVSSFKANLEKFFLDVRADLNLTSLPIIQVEIASGDKRGSRFVNEIRTIQQSIRLPNLVSVDAYGLPKIPDDVHLNTASQVKLGHMLADAYLNNFSWERPILLVDSN